MASRLGLTDKEILEAVRDLERRNPEIQTAADGKTKLKLHVIAVAVYKPADEPVEDRIQRMSGASGQMWVDDMEGIG